MYIYILHECIYSFKYIYIKEYIYICSYLVIFIYLYNVLLCSFIGYLFFLCFMIYFIYPCIFNLFILALYFFHNVFCLCLGFTRRH